MVSPSKQIFKCFGCGKGGNAITFFQEIERIDFRDAVKELAKQSNVDISKYTSSSYHTQAHTDEKEKIKRLHKLAQQFFVDELQKSPAAMDYLHSKRQLDDATIEAFGIGYAPDSHYSLLQYLRSKWFTDTDIIEASLAKKWQSWEAYAFFKHRIMFPIYDLMNNVVGFSARIINPEDKPKYLNSAEHKAFEKSKLLYGLNIVKQEIRHHNAIVILEGQMDVIALSRLGLPIGVATCGTALTPDHIKIIKKYTDTVYLLFDNDSAGHEASFRALGLCYQHNIFPKIITLPEAYKDTDELTHIPEGKDILHQAYQAAGDGFVVSFERLKVQFDITTPVGKQKILHAVFGLIQHMNNLSLQQHYIQTISDYLRTPFEVVYEQYKKYSLEEGKFLVPRKKAEVGYQVDRIALAGSLFYERFLDTYQETQELWEPLHALVSHIARLYPESIFAQFVQVDDIERIQEIQELQLRWDQELWDKDEKKRYQLVMQTIGTVINTYIQHMLKQKTISAEDKNEVLKLKKQIE